MQNKFSIQARKNTKGKTVYYVQFWIEDEGRYGTAKSTGQTNKHAAAAWAQQMLESNHENKKNPTFQNFSSGIFRPESEYVKRETLRGRTKSVEHLANQDAYLRNHINPIIGKKLVKRINSENLEDLALALVDKGLSGETINHILQTVTIVMKWAQKKKVISNIPMVESVRANHKERGILTEEEAIKLLSLPTWQLDHLVVNMLLHTTAIRLSECLALRKSTIDLTNNRIYIGNSWSRAVGLKDTKTKDKKFVPLTSRTKIVLERLLNERSYLQDDDFIFHGRDRTRPIDRKAVLQMFCKKLEEIGIGPKERETRNIVLHSHRHFRNSHLLNNGAVEQKVQLLTGHRTKEMTENYYHPDDMKDIVQLIEKQTEGIDSPLFQDETASKTLRNII